MIDKDNFKAVLTSLAFKEENGIFTKHFTEGDFYLRVDFAKEELIYPIEKGFIINEKQTCNFSAKENFVVFECVHRLLAKGYKPEHIELEPKWKVGHGASGGRADIFVKDQQAKPLLIIECKTAGREFDKAWKDTLDDGGQLFSYIEQEKAVEFVCLYASDFDEAKKEIRIYQRIISHKDNEQILTDSKLLKPFKDAKNVKERFKVWKETYQLEYTEKGIFEENILPYSVGKDKYTLAIDTKEIDSEDIKGKYHVFRTILRKYNVSRRENAFEVLVNLFLCKLVDEIENPQELKFYWKGIAYDNYFDLVDRLQALYKIGMERFLAQDILYVSNDDIDDAFWAFKQKRNASKQRIKDIFRELKFFNDNDFGFISVKNKTSFNQNAKILLEIIQMWQGLRLKTEGQMQFLGDMFEFFLDNGIKQSEGQFFTPIPICKFIVTALPIENKLKNTQTPLKAIDYACGSGHFLTEYAMQIAALVKQYKQTDPKEYYKNIYGIEKEDRLAKVAKVSAFMYGRDEIKVLDADALAINPDIKHESFDILVANPPFAVEDFLLTLSDEDREKYSLLQTVSDLGNKNIQCFFLERAKQLLAPDGVMGVIVPSSVLSNSDGMHIATREILLKYFDFVSIVELGSGTFGKTGTNTVVLFLRRKAYNPEAAEHYWNRVQDFFEQWEEEKQSGGGAYLDTDLVRQYCQHIDLSFEAYQTLLVGKPSAELMATEIFTDYQKDFDKSTEIVNLKTRFAKQLADLPKVILTELEKQQKTEKGKVEKAELLAARDKALPLRIAALEAEHAATLAKKLLAYLQAIEMDKLYYYLLAANNPTKVLLVKSPSDNKEQKQFLGYEWSGAKGSEGIKYNGGDTVTQIVTPMFDPNDRKNPNKIAYYIQQNFAGKSLPTFPDALQPFLTTARLQDMLDFSRKDFNKAFSLNSKKNVGIETKWELVKLEDICVLGRGRVINHNYIDENPGEYPVYSSQTQNEGIMGYINTFDFEGEYVTWTTDGIYAGTCFYRIGKFNCTNVCGTLKVKDSTSVITQFLPLVLNGITADYVVKSANPKLMNNVMANVKIPLPPLAIQQQIVAECEAIDKAVSEAQARIAGAKEEIAERIASINEKGYSIKKLSDICAMQAGKFVPAAEINDKNEEGLYPCFGGNGLRGYVKTFTNEGTYPLIGRQGALCGNVKIVTGKFHATEHAVVVSPKSDINVLWLYYQLTAMNLNQYATGVAQPGLSVQTILNVTTPVPPLSEQKLLVSAIEQQEAIITAAQELVASAASKKQAVMQAYL